MKLSRYLYKNHHGYGLLGEESVLNMPALAKNFKTELPITIEDFIADGESSLDTAKALINRATKADLARVSVPQSEVQLLPPLLFPPKILCLGLNYLDHAAETKLAVPTEPIVFMKPHTTITRTNAKIQKPIYVKELDYEGELVIVVGKKAKNIPAEKAQDYIFGYTIMNDVSARDFQFKNSQWTPGKSFDTFAPTGPCITTKNQMLDICDVHIRTWVNDELRQNGSTCNMIFDVNQIICYLSRIMTLEPCDIIATGTPAGVGMAKNPKTWLKHGDTVRIEIDGIGTLENQVEER